MKKTKHVVSNTKVIQVNVEDLTYINEIIKKNIDTSFTFMPIKQDIKIIMTTFHSQDYINTISSLKYITKHKNNYSKKYPKEILSIILFLLLYLIEKNDHSKEEQIEFIEGEMIHIILDLITKLHSNQSFTNDDIIKIIIFVIGMSIELRNEIIIPKNNIIPPYADITNKKIKHVLIFNLSLDLVVRLHDKNITEFYCDYCKNKVFLNKANLFLLTKQSNLLSLLQIKSSEIQLDLLSKVYMNRYSKVFIEYFVNNIKKALLASNEEVINHFPVLKKQTDLLSLMHKEEIDEITKDSMQLKRGFVFNNTPTNGMYASNVIVKDQFSVVFSFNYSPGYKRNLENQVYIMVFKSGNATDDKNLKDAIAFSIKNSKFYLKVLDDTETEIFDVKQNITYLVYFSMKERDQYLLSIKTEDNQWLHKKNCKMFLKKNFTLHVGRYVKSNFEGYIGPILVFKSLLEDNFRFSCFSLKGNYEKLLYLPEYDMTQIDKYDREMNNTSIENAEYYESINFFKTNFDATKNLLCYIAPPCLAEKAGKTIYKNCLFKECKIHYAKEPKIENEGTFVFENHCMIFEFLKYAGIDFLVLNYEVYTKIMSVGKISQNDYDLLQKNVCSLLEFSIEFLNMINIELYSKEIKKLLFAISKFVRKMSETYKLKDDLFVLLNKWLIILSSQNPEIKNKNARLYLMLRNQFCMLLLDPSLFDLKDYHTLESFFYSFENCFVRNKEGLGTPLVLKQFLQMADFYHFADKSPEFKNVKTVYNSIVSHYLKKNDSHELYYELFNSFNNIYEISYKEYQLIQLFYLHSELISMYDQRFQPVMTYFIQLFEYLDKKGKCNLSPKQREIIKGITLRIILEYPSTEDFYFPDQRKKKKKRLYSVDIKKNQSTDIVSMQNPIDTSFLNIPNTICEDNYGLMMDPKSDSDNEIIPQKKQEPEAPPKFISSNMFEYYETYDRVCDNIKRASDYVIKCLMLVIFDTDLKPDKKLAFIKKANEYNKIENYEFIALNEYGTDIKKLFLPIVSIIERNKEELKFAYELFLYLVLKIAKERETNYCVFNHFLSSRRICSKVFLLSHHCSEAIYLIQGEFKDIIQYILPYHKSSFIYDFIKNLTLTKGQAKTGSYFINLILRAQFPTKTSKFFYSDQISKALLLYEIFKDKNLKTEQLFYECSNFTDLFKSDLMKTRFNLLQYLPNCKKKKTYMEIMLSILLKLVNDSTKGDFDSILNCILTPKEDPCFINDSFNLPNIAKNSTLNTLFGKQYKQINYPSMTSYFCMKYLISLTAENKLNNVSEKLVQILLAFLRITLTNAVSLYKSYSSCQKASKKSNVYNIVNDLIIECMKNPDFMKDNEFICNNVLIEFKQRVGVNNIDMKALPEWVLNSPAENNNDNILNNSVLSCNSNKLQKTNCQWKRKPKERRKIRDNLPINNQIINENLDYFNPDNDLFNNIDLQIDFNISSFSSSDEVVLFPKDSLLFKTFSIYFKDIYFTNEEFMRMKKYYKYLYEKYDNNDTDQEIDCTLLPEYPTIVKNFTPLNFYFKGLFMRHDLSFFNDNLFQFTHPYYKDIFDKRAKSDKRLFPSRAHMGIILPDNHLQFKALYCELITNQGVIFGQVKIYNQFIYFENLSRDEEENNMKDSDPYLFLFSSNENDFIRKPKKVHIFQKEIYHIINRRFLYQFQACEVYLMNGKSYFFNFFTEEKKSQFFNHVSTWTIDIIEDLKEHFKIKEYTKKWQLGTMSNLDYILMINKYASRSYNDINQYPVLPWVKLINNKTRNLKYTTCAQTEQQQMHLAEKYSLIDLPFPSHYNIHYSNSSLVLFYLFRLNPYTNNQVILQKDKVENPNRQFASMQDSLSALETLYDSREAVPELYILTELFYNLNCVYFGFRSKTQKIVHNLLPLNNLSPIEYIIDQKIFFNSNEIKQNLHQFIDNVFGCGQIGKKENYNTYEKYCYQELVSLSRKRNQYLKEKISIEQIKEKIQRKINKIVSFGQTPFKLLEDNHVVWSMEKDKKKKEDDSATKITKMSLNNKIITVFQSSNRNNICVLLKSTNAFCEIKILDTSLNIDDKYKTFLIKKKFKKLDKFKLSESPPLFAYKYNPKFILIEFNLHIFILCRFLDNSFTLVNDTGEMKSFIIDSFVSCIIKTKDKHFITGHFDGRIIEWNIGGASIEYPTLISEEKITEIRALMAHTKEINGLFYDNTLGLLITAGLDQYIYIRKYYDFGLMSVIDIRHHFLYELKLSNCFIYALMYSEHENKYVMKAYTMNGVKLFNVDEDYYNNIDIGDNGNVILGYSLEKSFTVFTPYFTGKRNDILIDLKSTKKEEEKDKARKFLHFCYIGNNTIICTFSNDLLVKYSYKNDENKSII